MACIARRFENAETKRSSQKSDIWFLNRCLAEKLTPKFAIIKVSNNFSPNESYIQKMQKMLVTQARRERYKKLEKYTREAESLYAQLLAENNRAGAARIQKSIEQKIKQKNLRLKKKLDELREEKYPPDMISGKTYSEEIPDTCQFHPRVKFLPDNLQNIFTASEIELLKLGFKHSFYSPINQNSLSKFSIDIDVAIQRLKINKPTKEYIRGEVAEKLREHLIREGNKPSKRNRIQRQTDLIIN